MPVDPMVRKILDRMNQLPDTCDLPLEAARASFKWRLPDKLRVDPVASVRDIVIPGLPPLMARLYTPLGIGPFPLIVFFHGSGFVVCDLDTHDPMSRNLCHGTKAIVLSVDYRLAPEHKYPAAGDDCYRAVRWGANAAQDIGAVPGLIALAGDSAGGNLAAVTALRIRDHGGPRLCAQLLIYPVTDYYRPGTSSYQENAEGYGLTRKTMQWFWDHYLKDEMDSQSPYACPLKADNLAGLPPALIYTAQYDPLRDEGEQYARRLSDAGVEAKLIRWDGMHHGFLFFPGIIGKADLALDEACKWLRERFNKCSI